MTTTEVQKKAEPENIGALLAKMKNQFSMALPKHITAERFMRVALTAINKNSKLLACTKESLLACLMDLSQMGLEPDGRKAHLIPYGNQCTLIVDYKGLVDLARRSGEVSYIHADVACENDTFEFAFGSGAHLKHIPAAGDRGKVKHVYSFVKLKDGSEDFDVMSVEDVEKVRKRSKAGTNGPWVTDWNEMAKKTVFRRHSKWLPVSSEKFKDAIEKDGDLPIDLIPTGSELVEVPEVPQAAVASGTPAAPVLASEVQVKKLEALAAQAGIKDGDYLDWLKEQGVKDASAVTLEELRRCMQAVIEAMDKKASRKTNAKASA